MAAQTQTELSVEEYLRIRFEGPTPEYFDGQLVERYLGNYAHGKTQRRLAAVFDELAKRHPLYAATELHLSLASRRYRIADVAVYAEEEPKESIPSYPPLIVIEILSPQDSLQYVFGRFEELRAWGVKYLWLANPDLRKIYVYEGGLREIQAFTIPEYQVEISGASIFGS